MKNLLPCEARARKSSRSQIATLICLLMLVFCLTGCWHTLPAQQYNNLPVSQGFYGGSMLWEPWEYHGSDANHHYVRYTYIQSEWLRRRDIRFFRSEIQLRYLRIVPYQSGPVCALEPVLVGNKLTGFDWKRWNMERWRWENHGLSLLSGDRGLSNLIYSLEPLELKLAPPPKLEDYIGKP